ncbi:MAG: Acetyltransferase, GNAT family [Candidatus Woesebacteria bacterium GW2011_GWB1_43_14]|uniref:Acetyltransferase, GNAT family n=1 Tax=Candidatus Woesebacteria bacterium GW2011_GWB1_43_14 TaxID=1618578 RepID=A0A0G1FQ12_9BACT|nr:MAG: Acetyltransferase, GNAT family [Candidatus Woesebacteria bacterium GW2011_GWA1_39_11b]KKS78483.1 MAG: Acetyltransferase, GNAT family [Candidatus Woesebacteria bacterium GW2011_GWC1_42_9]KKS97101.1 MAG: Acetyltransferase, GNAT family [Candidatus Woesebacteria bacterium GW2011_GWB1_43_14]
MRIKIEKLNEKDIPEIIKLHRLVVSEENSKYYPAGVIEEWLSEINEENIKLQTAKTEWLIARSDEIVGFGQYSLETNEILQINVSPLQKNKGIGRAIYLKIEEIFKKRLTKKISLNATVNSIGFYKKMGFKEKNRIFFSIKTKKVEMVRMEKEF